MIFPLFLFLAGVSFPFSLSKQLSIGRTKGDIYRKIILRALAFIILGFLYQNSVRFNFAQLRFPSVLGTIGVAWMIAAIVFMNTKFWSRIAYCVFVLVAYWLLLAMVPAPDTASQDAFTAQAWRDRACHLLSPNENIRNNFTPEGCIIGYVDRQCIPGRLYRGNFDGATEIVFTASVTAMLGMLCGAFIRRREEMSPYYQTVVLTISGVTLVLLGLIWNQVFPINKPMWTSSYVCFAGGLSILVLALFYYVIDVLNYRQWTFFFVVIGINSIAAYMARPILGLHHTNEFLFRGFANFAHDPAMQKLIMAAGYIITTWLVLLFLYRKKIFFKV